MIGECPKAASACLSMALHVTKVTYTFDSRGLWPAMLLCSHPLPGIYHLPHKYYLINSTNIFVGNKSVMITEIKSQRIFSVMITDGKQTLQR